MQPVLVDPDSRSLDHRFGVVHAPKRQRARFPEACVTLTRNEAEARAQADPDRHRHPAEVYGPSVSSEGQRIYYLVRWLA